MTCDLIRTGLTILQTLQHCAALYAMWNKRPPYGRKLLYLSLLCFGDVRIDIQLTFGFRLLQCTRFLQIYTQPLGLDLSDGTSKPLPSPQKPASNGPECDNAHCHGCIVQSLRINWIRGWETENDGDETDPPEENGY